MIGATVYILCVVTSALCAWLLLAEYRRRRARLLLWSGASFIGFAVSNALVVADLLILPDVDLSVLRAASACGSVAILLYGLVWDSD